MSKTTDILNSIEQSQENFKSKYVIANAIKTNKFSSKLTKTNNNITISKNFIGFDEDDYKTVEKMCDSDNVNLFVKNKSHFFDDINCNKNLNVCMKTNIGFDENECNKLNSLTDNIKLNVKGDSNINGELSVFQNVNIGFNENIPENTSKLNVNGNSEFVGNNVIYGSEYIKNNLIVNNKTTFYNDIFLIPFDRFHV